MADAWARLTGRPGVVPGHRRPGIRQHAVCVVPGNGGRVSSSSNERPFAEWPAWTRRLPGDAAGRDGRPRHQGLVDCIRGLGAGSRRGPRPSHRRLWTARAGAPGPPSGPPRGRGEGLASARRLPAVRRRHRWADCKGDPGLPGRGPDDHSC